MRRFWAVSSSGFGRGDWTGMRFARMREARNGRMLASSASSPWSLVAMPCSCRCCCSWPSCCWSDSSSSFAFAPASAVANAGYAETDAEERVEEELSVELMRVASSGGRSRATSSESVSGESPPAPPVALLPPVDSVRHESRYRQCSSI